jgi:hypothetical protein
MSRPRTITDTSDEKSVRFRSRPANAGWLVLDTWTGAPVEIGGLAQVGLSKVDADHTAQMLQGRATGADR